MEDPKKKPFAYTYNLPVSASIMESVRKAIGLGTPGKAFLNLQASQNVWALNAGIGVAAGSSLLRAAGAYRSPIAGLKVINFKQDLLASAAGMPSSAVLHAVGAYQSPFVDLRITDLFKLKHDVLGASFTSVPSNAVLRAAGAYRSPFADLRVKQFPALGQSLFGFDGSVFLRGLAAGVAAKAADLAELLFPSNLQGFTDDEWDRLIALCTEDGIGMMFAPSADHLRALLKASDRAARYAYLMAHKGALLDEINDGLNDVEHEDLEDLVELAIRAVDCAAAGHWEGALSIAANVTNTAVEQHAIAWYRDEFSSTRNAQNVPITGVRGPGATIDYVVTNIPLPERTVGVFELRAHLVVRPLSSTFQHTSTGNDTFNRNAVAHTSSYDSYREEFTVPALLTMHSLLRGLDEKLHEDDE
ncbi:hypothetical protein [Streptomyces anulatus]|uniref:hypothetical protein n=1 Tax=Streptomyces anulatus TaxID=1892 RepID=UPI002F90DD49|nr:hypothetical protein OG238_41650 [Streptomyces anulatus]